MNFIPLTRKKTFHRRLGRSCKRSLERHHIKGHRIKLVYLCYLHSRGSKGQLWGSCSTEPAEKCRPVHTDPEADPQCSAQSDPPSTAKSKTDGKQGWLLSCVQVTADCVSVRISMGSCNCREHRTCEIQGCHQKEWLRHRKLPLSHAFFCWVTPCSSRASSDTQASLTFLGTLLNSHQKNK